MLAGEAAAELDHEVGDLFGQAFRRLETGLVLDVDDGADVEAAGGGVAVVAGAEAEVADGDIEAGDEFGQLIGRDGGILDEGDGLGVAVHRHEQAEAGLAHAPHPRLRGWIEFGHGGVAGAGAEQVVLDPRELPADIFLVLAECFDQQHCAGLALDEISERGIAGR